MKYALILYIIIMNILAFALYAVDKRRAQRHMWRISESALLTVSALGGALGALCAIHGLHHKTKHYKFIILVPLFLLLDAAVFAYAFYMIG